MAGKAAAWEPVASHRVAAALAFSSQLIYLWTLPVEFAARPLSGLFVLLAAMGQGLLAVGLLFGPGKWTVRFGLVLNAEIVVAWSATRVAGFPPLLGFARLPIEPLGLITTGVEIALLVLLIRVGRRMKTQPNRRRAW